jgi:hypothetical protein
MRLAKESTEPVIDSEPYWIGPRIFFTSALLKRKHWAWTLIRMDWGPPCLTRFSIRLLGRILQ